MAVKKPDPSADTLRPIAAGLLEFARDRDLDRLVADATLHESGAWIQVIIERKSVPAREATPDVQLDEEEADHMVVVSEHITVKVGPPSKPRIVVAAPAAWVAP